MIAGQAADLCIMAKQALKTSITKQVGVAEKQAHSLLESLEACRTRFWLKKYQQQGHS